MRQGRPGIGLPASTLAAARSFMCPPRAHNSGTSVAASCATYDYVIWLAIRFLAVQAPDVKRTYYQQRCAHHARTVIDMAWAPRQWAEKPSGRASGKQAGKERTQKNSIQAAVHLLPRQAAPAKSRQPDCPNKARLHPHQPYVAGSTTVSTLLGRPQTDPDSGDSERLRLPCANQAAAAHCSGPDPAHAPTRPLRGAQAGRRYRAVHGFHENPPTGFHLPSYSSASRFAYPALNRKAVDVSRHQIRWNALLRVVKYCQLSSVYELVTLIVAKPATP